jgi:putative transposase
MSRGLRPSQPRGAATPGSDLDFPLENRDLTPDQGQAQNCDAARDEAAQVLRTTGAPARESSRNWNKNARLAAAMILLLRYGMARPMRLHVPGVPAHVVSRGNRKECIFLDDADHERFLHLLALSLSRFKATCHAYCLMWNHAHLLLTPSELPLARLMQYLNSSYCGWFNAQHRFVGHVLQGRYDGRLIDDGYYLLNALRYLALNPVVAGKVSRPEDWAWSSYRCTVGLAPVPPFLDLTAVWNALGTDDPDEGQRLFSQFVESGDEVHGWCEVMLGSERLAARLRPLVRANREEREFVYAQRFALRPGLDSLLRGVERGPDLDWAVRTAFREHGYTLREIGEYVGRPPSTVWSWVRRAVAAPRPSGLLQAGDPAWCD